MPDSALKLTSEIVTHLWKRTELGKREEEKASNNMF